MTRVEKPRIWKAPILPMWVCNYPRLTGSLRGFGATPKEAYESWSGKWYVWQESRRVYSLSPITYHRTRGT